MQTVFETNNGLEAQEVKGFLEAFGIASIIVGVAGDRSAAFTPGASHAPVRVQVTDEDHEEAIALLQSRPDE